MNDHPSTTRNSEIVKLDFDKLPKSVGIVVAALLTALSKEILSGDLLYLAFSNAMQIAIENGVPEDEAEELLKRLAAVFEAGRKGNPMSSMF